MSKILKKQPSQKPYRQVILDRLNKELQKSHKKSHNINSLKTQCTPNDKTQQIYEKVFEEFQDAVKVKYKPISTISNKKPIKRCIYMDLLEIQKNGGAKSKQKTTGNKQVKRKCFTQSCQKNPEKEIILKGKKSGRISRENTSKKSSNPQKYKVKEENMTLKRQISSSNLIAFKRSQSLQILPVASRVSTNLENLQKKESKSKKVLSPYKKRQFRQKHNF